MDPNQLEMAILNLVLNSRDAMVDGGSITIETSNAQLDDHYVKNYADLTPGEFVCIAVTDSGAGMTDHVLEKIFQPFFSTKPPGQGTGLGLSMVYGFVKQSCGHINAYSEIGVGTCIKLYLPCYGSKVSETWETEIFSEPSGRGGHETILVVEDNQGIRTVVVDYLESLGYAVIPAEDGIHALKELERCDHIDLLFTDIVMPGLLSGIKLAKEVSECRPSTKILFTSGYAEASLLRSQSLLDGHNLLSKPYRHKELAQKIRMTLDGCLPSSACTDA